ncbi:hypothetical protein CNMCM5793_005274 [Aspergillus hiratsukae]|uniref:Uncharacterized protein n=1 Tax=Aspergillus hiratsukae TaxID=1194566 RepID=A0A8H6PGB7_9EURO|nr:hypothetical protein CNMCM5793_005274 [Aspergillus hiratsukae]
MADNNIRDRLRSMAFDLGEARDALRGKDVPVALGRRVTRLCVIRGIRYHEEFAEHPDLEQLRRYVPEVSRALNARAIMSNKIPSMPEARDRPYCIWHPQVALQDTYRKLWQQYPDMSYQIARACAVANYVELYLEMDLLPDVSIAEEARASGSMDIYEAIMRNPVRYRIMNDYTREITLQNPKPACLNDDTAVVSTLDIKQGIRKPRGEEIEPIIEGSQDADDMFDDEMDYLIPFPGFDEKMFNITEDMNVAVYTEDKDLFDWMLDDLGVAPTRPAFQEARVRNRGDAPSYFVHRLEARSQELGIDLAAPVASFKMYSAQPQQSSIWLAKELTPGEVHSSVEDWGFYDGYIVDASEVELFASAPEPWRPGSWKVELD